ncbi:hypothetical protein LY624_09460 [Pseudoalteromonas sp. N1230-9]|uniref:hypothetical protein n=1 Tax=Pseudoalteromonas sp. N1230-9 TaxID=2907156 RepID=UPI002B300CF9|nr:hypothetical protein LY624_09460 [Pseudoalteromonas sp. N1230-9]
MAEVIEENTLLESATVSLLRVQEFDVDQLPRVNELGSSLNFQNSIEPAKRLISLYKRLSTTALEDFPDNVLTQIKQQCDAGYQINTLKCFCPQTGYKHNSPLSKNEFILQSAYREYKTVRFYQGLPIKPDRI